MVGIYQYTVIQLHGCQESLQDSQLPVKAYQGFTLWWIHEALWICLEIDFNETQFYKDISNCLLC